MILIDGYKLTSITGNLESRDRSAGVGRGRRAAATGEQRVASGAAPGGTAGPGTRRTPAY